jgi:hypothetical protein
MPLKRVTIIGGGPSAVYAIVACNDYGIVPTVLSSGINLNPGAMWLHSIPERFAEGSKQERIVVTRVGERENYIKKQWGEFPRGYKSSFPEYEHVEYGYNPQHTIPYILSKCDFEHFPCGNLTDKEIITRSKQAELVFHSFPSELGRKHLGYMMAKIPVSVSTYDVKQGNRVIYNGREKDMVVRVSYLFGKKSTEYSAHYMDSKDLDAKTNKFSKHDNVVYIDDLKPTNLTYTVPYLAYNIIPIGRLGRFDRTVLAHDTYYLVEEILREL